MSAAGTLLGGLPEDIVGAVFTLLLRASRGSALALAFTSKLHLRVFQSAQVAIALPDALPDVARAISYVLPAAPSATTTLILSRQALDPAVADLWAVGPPLPHVRTLHIPALRRSPLFNQQTQQYRQAQDHHLSQLVINGNDDDIHASDSRALATHRYPQACCLLSILSRLPGLTTLSLSLAAPGPDPAVFDLPALIAARINGPDHFLSNLSKLVVTATGPYLHPDAQQLLPLLLRAMSGSIAHFSIVLPPRIIPTDFISDVLDVLGRASSLRDVCLTLPFYNFLSCQPGYSPTPHLKSLTLGAISLPLVTSPGAGTAFNSKIHGNECAMTDSEESSPRRSVDLERVWGRLAGTGRYGAVVGANALLAHLPLWRSLELLVVHSASPESIDALFAALDHRVLSVTVAKRPLRSPLSFDWLSGAPWWYAPVGVDRDALAAAFMRRFWHRPTGECLNSSVPVFDKQAASRFPRQNYVAIRLIVGDSHLPGCG
jgi:hypothetical protein